MNNAFLLTGGNLGQPQLNLDLARSLIARECGEILRVSAFYRTAAWGLAGQPDFLNQAIQLGTTLEPMLLLENLLDIEQRIGRIRKEKYGPRLIDIDILLYDDVIADQPGLFLPHPRLAERRFALIPLDEIAPALVHPVSGKTIHQLLLGCTDPLPVERLD